MIRLSFNKDFLDRYGIVLICAFVASLPLKPGINNGVLIGITAVWLIFGGPRRSLHLAKHSTLYWAIVVNFVILSLSLFYSEHSNGIGAITRRIPLIVIPFVFPTLLASNHKIITKFYIITWFCVTLFSLFVTIYIYEISLGELAYFSWRLPDSINLGANYYALFVGMALLMLVDDWKKRSLFHSTIFHVFLGVYLVLFLALLASRNAFFCVVGIIVFKLFFDLNQQGKRWLSFVTIGVSIVFFAIIFTSFPYLKEKTYSIYKLGIKAEPRYMELVSGLDVFMSSPLAGVGVGDTEAELLKHYAKHNFTEGLANKYNVHNEYLYHGMAAGILGLLSFVIIACLSFRHAFASPYFLPKAFCLLFFICCLTEVILFRNKGIAFFSFFISYFFIESDEKNTAR